MITVPYEVKKALRDGMLRKNYRFLVLNDDGTTDFTIDNDTLVSESVSIDERMCSGDTLKFGLCEGSSLEFQYFNHPNIYERRIQAFVDVQYLAGVVGRINASGSFTAPVNGSYTFEVKKGSATGLYITFAGGGDIYVDFVLGQTTDTEELEAGDVVTLYNPSSDALFEVSADMWDTIPMGFFDVKKCSRQASTGIMKATAYNKLMSEYLDTKATDEITAIVAEGEDDLDSVSLYTILDELLEGFSIEYKNEVSVPAVVGSVGASFGVQAPAYINGSENGYYNVFGYNIVLTVDGFNSDDYYRFVANIEKVKEKVNGLFSGKYSAGGTLLDYLINVSWWDHSFKDAAGGFGLSHTGSFSNVYFMWFQLTESPDYIELPTFHTNLAAGVKFRLPLVIEHTQTQAPVPSTVVPSAAIQQQLATVYSQWSTYFGDFLTIIKNDLTDAQKIRLSTGTTIPDVTLRELQSAVYEMSCQFGQLSRVTDLFEGVELNNGGLYPAEDLYPADNLYPSGASMSASKAMYSQLWADEGNVRKWRYLIITYKGLDEDQNEKDYTLQRTVNADGTDDYNMSDNWLFRNLIWTAQQVGNYADAMVTKMQNNEWFPFEMWCAGLPYLETGDQIEIPLNGEVYKSYILQRQLKGIQNLQDTYINGTLDIF